MHPEQASSIGYNETAYGTVAVVDMVGYSTLVKVLQENLGAHAVADLNRQIQEFVQSALRHLDNPSSYTKIADTGDGAILLFKSAHDAHIFAEQLHLNTEKHNRSRNEATAMRRFRIGISSGEVNREKLLLEKEKYASITIADAVRLEAAAEAGETVIDSETFGILPKGDRVSYGPETMVRGKRDEVFSARRYKVVNPANVPEPGVKPGSRNSSTKFGVIAALVIAGVALLLAVPHLRPSESSPDLPNLQSVQAKPNVVKKGDTVAITVVIDRPAPKNGVKIVLSSSDPSILTVDGSATVYQGETFGTAYSRAVSVPGYLSPIQVVATYNGETVRTTASVIGQGTRPAEQPALPNQAQSDLATPAQKPPADQSAQASQAESTLSPLPAVKGTADTLLEGCTIYGELTITKATARLIYKASKPLVEAFVELHNSSPVRVSFILIGPAQFTDTVDRQTDSTSTTAPNAGALPGPGGSAIFGVVGAAELLEPGQSKSFELGFPVPLDSKTQGGELTFTLATFVGPNIAGAAGFATKGQKQTVRCVGK